MTTRASSGIDEARLWSRLQTLARHGATAAGGVNRQALSDEEVSAWREVIAWGLSLGLAPRRDDAGNLFLRLEGSVLDAEPVLSGSHLDSQPTGGKFDGAYGVLAALEAVEAIISSGVKLKRPIEIVAWMNEEGSRFAPGMMGSSAFADPSLLARYRPVKDADGISVDDGLRLMDASFPEVPKLPLGRRVNSYVEAHIEQGPILEKESTSVGAVSGIQGKRTFRVTVTGEEAHAGTTTRKERRDALQAAVRMVSALDDAMRDDNDLVMFTVGRFEVRPNAPSVVPSLVTFSVDLRHPHENVLRELGDRIAGIVAKHRGPCVAEVVELSSAMPLHFPSDITGMIRRHANALNISCMDIFSAAGHDARYLHYICSSGMIFVPCKNGVSHNEAESAKPRDLADGARVLADVLVELASN